MALQGQWDGVKVAVVVLLCSYCLLSPIKRSFINVMFVISAEMRHQHSSVSLFFFEQTAHYSSHHCHIDAVADTPKAVLKTHSIWPRKLDREARQQQDFVRMKESQAVPIASQCTAIQLVSWICLWSTGRGTVARPRRSIVYLAIALGETVTEAVEGRHQRQQVRCPRCIQDAWWQPQLLMVRRVDDNMLAS